MSNYYQDVAVLVEEVYGSLANPNNYNGLLNDMTQLTGIHPDHLEVYFEDPDALDPGEANIIENAVADSLLTLSDAQESIDAGEYTPEQYYPADDNIDLADIVNELDQIAYEQELRQAYLEEQTDKIESLAAYLSDQADAGYQDEAISEVLTQQEANFSAQINNLERKINELNQEISWRDNFAFIDEELSNLIQTGRYMIETEICTPAQLEATFSAEILYAEPEKRTEKLLHFSQQRDTDAKNILTWFRETLNVLAHSTQPSLANFSAEETLTDRAEEIRGLLPHVANAIENNNLDAIWG
jgi:hypothetical protein